MSKSYDEQIANLQKKISEVKRKKERERKDHIAKIGQAVSDRLPSLLEKMQSDNFNIFQYVKTKSFTDELYALQKNDANPAKQEPPVRQEPQSVKTLN